MMNKNLTGLVKSRKVLKTFVLMHRLMDQVMKVGASEIKPGAQIEEGLDLMLKKKSQMKSFKRQKSSTCKDLQRTLD